MSKSLGEIRTEVDQDALVLASDELAREFGYQEFYAGICATLCGMTGPSAEDPRTPRAESVCRGNWSI